MHRGGATAVGGLYRRHMTKGQRAMAVAMIHSVPEKGGRGKKSLKITEFGFDPSYLSHARPEPHDVED